MKRLVYLDYIEESAGSDGRTIHDLLQDVSAEVLATGRAGVFVDTPENEGGQTIAEIKAGVNVPQITTYNAQQIFYWRNKGQLQEVRLIETYEERVNELNYEDKEQIRRLFIDDNGNYVNQVWREEEVYSEVMPTINGSLMK